MKRFFSYITLFLAIGLMSSCTDQEDSIETKGSGSEKEESEKVVGAWDAMQWKSENIKGDVSVKYVSNGLVEFNISGEGSVDMVCNNYFPWISYGTYYPEIPDDITVYEYEWLHVSIKENVVKCEFDNVPEDFHKEIYVEMTAGDIFCTFLFKREEDYGPSGKWAPLAWTVENLEGDMEMESFTSRSNIIVEGKCSFDLVCLNYDDIWFTSGLFTPDPLDIHHVDFDWFHLNILDNVLHIDLDPWNGTMEEFKANPEVWSGESPYMDIDVSAGEISHTLNIYQKGLLNR